MNKFRAKVRFYGKRNSDELVKAFFQEFNPASTLELSEKEAEMEIVFDENPKTIIDAINKCKVVFLKYGNLSEEKHIEIENFTPQEKKVQAKQTHEKVNKSNLKKKIEPKEKKEDAAAKASEKISIIELDKIAEKANSFEDFVKQISNRLQFDKKEQLLFTKLAIASTNVEKVTWNRLKSHIRNKGQTYSDYLRKRVVKNYEENLKESDNTSIFQFFTLLKKYKEYPFSKAEKEIKSGIKATSKKAEIKDVDGRLKEQPNPKTVLDVEEAKGKRSEGLEQENAKDEATKSGLKLKCIPEVKELEEALASVDKTKPVEERIVHVLLPMGLAKLPTQEQQWILQIANATIRKKTIDLKQIILTTGIPEDKRMTARIKFSNLINSFAKSHGGNEDITLAEFLSELQKVIINEAEIETIQTP